MSSKNRFFKDISIDKRMASAEGGLGKIASEMGSKLSIVTTVYKSRGFLDDFVKECLDTIKQLEIYDFELLFVIDGSPDDSLEYLIDRRTTVPQIVIVELARNFGHHHAIMAGLTHARGDLIFLVDCDLEVRPGVLAEFSRKMQEGDCDVVYGYQKHRKGGFFERYSGGIFWKIFNYISSTEVPENVLTERLMNRRYVDALLTLGDKNLFLGGMMSWVGFNQVGVPVLKTQREGATSYTFFKRVALLVDAITSFSSSPLKLLFYSGTVLTALSFVSMFYLIIRKLLSPESVLLGFTFLAALSLLNLGLIVLALGIIGIYLARVFLQGQNRPTFIVRNVYKENKH